MTNMNTYARSASAQTVDLLATHKVLRNTYALLAMTLLFSAAMAGLAWKIELPFWASLVCSISALVMLWFVVPRTANSAAGIGVVFVVTGLLGFGLGPLLNHYLSMPNGPALVMTAMSGTGVTFLVMSGIALVTRKDFSFLGRFLMIGVLVAFVAGIAAMVFGLSGLSLAVAAMFALLSSLLILWETSNIVNGGETNYIMATTSLYVSIYNLFTSLLQLLGFSSSDD